MRKNGWLKHFPISTQVNFRDDERNQRTIMEVTTGDQPGLLAKIAAALVKNGIRLQNAKIATFGERAEDIFFITDRELQPITDQARRGKLKDTIVEMLGQ